MEFIDPKSPLSLATTVFLVLMLSSFAWKLFGFNQEITGFILSLIFSGMRMRGFKIDFVEKIIYIFINSCLIFSSALGGNTFMSRPFSTYTTTEHTVAIPVSSTTIVNERSFFDSWIK